MKTKIGKTKIEVSVRGELCSEMWTPTHDDYRLTAKVLLHTARLIEDLPWWKRWEYPISKLREYAGKFYSMADISLKMKKVNIT